MRVFDIEDETIDAEQEGWLEFQRNGCIGVRHGNGFTDRFVSIQYGWNDEEYYANAREFGLHAGYFTGGGRLSDSFNIPANVFEDLFPDDEAEWNCSESCHGFHCRSDETVHQAMARVAAVLEKVGFIRSE